MAKTPPKDTAPTSESYSPESWEEARRIAARIGAVPSAFTSCVHFLRKDCESSSGMLSAGSKFALGRLLKSEFFRGPLYYGAETFFSEELEQCDRLDADTFADLFGADGLAITVSLLYLYRRLQKDCDPTEWELLSQHVMIESELGAHIGKAIPNIGFPLALLVGGMRHLSNAIFLAADKKNFVAYRRARNKNPNRFDMDYEYKTWGCNHAQVAAILLQAVGLGVNLVDALLGGLNPVELPFDQIEPGALKVKLTTLWIQSLRETCSQPDMTHIGKYYPLKQDLEALVQKAEAVKASGSKYKWLTRGKEDVSPEKTPKLYHPSMRVKATEIVQPSEVDQEVAELDKELNEELEVKA